MSLLPIQKGPKNTILRTISDRAGKADKKLKKLIKDMEDTMFDLNGVGIAAPQVGVNLRLALARLNVDTPHEIIAVLINPEISNLSEEMSAIDEGCLSLPRQWGPTPRHKSITVTLDNLHGGKQTLHLTDFNARVVQHEVDHLNGILFIDRAHEVRKE